VSDRAKLFEKDILAAFDNLLIAQHHDTLRYAHTRSGHFQPKLHRFEVGDLVYLGRKRLAPWTSTIVGRLHLKMKEVLDPVDSFWRVETRKSSKSTLRTALHATTQISIYGIILDWLKGMWIKLARSAIRLHGG
jgi:hypothetical protein